MTLRIFLEANEHEAVIALHGWLTAAEVVEVDGMAAAQALPVRVDLEQLVGVDGAGLQALQRLQRYGARLTGASPYVELLLARTVLAPDADPVT